MTEDNAENYPIRSKTIFEPTLQRDFCIFSMVNFFYYNFFAPIRFVKFSLFLMNEARFQVFMNSTILNEFSTFEVLFRLYYGLSYFQSF